MENKIQDKIKEWTSELFDEKTRQEIQQLVDDKLHDELKDRFYKDLEFGTGGLRGIIGAGSNRINIYTVGMATQGLAGYILENSNETPSAVIARDSRNMSDIFARETASILAANGIDVLMFEDIMPTPLASFAIRHFNAKAGVVITASHNPKEYNGYKVYWDDGGQIVPPHDSNIIGRVKAVISPAEIKNGVFDEFLQSGRIKYIDNEAVSAYTEKLYQAFGPSPEKKKTRIVYTPIHGTGYRIVPEILKKAGFTDIHLVEDQTSPDGNFPTVKSPNPEERSAMEAALKKAKEVNADIVLATDPDSDRMGVGFRDKSGEYNLINGNQIGSMLEYYILQKAQDEKTMPENPVVLKTIVTTDLQKEIAAGFGCDVAEVLTGFKWIASSMLKYDHTGDKTFVFGGEESYGYLPVDFVRDKDAVSSIYYFCQMAENIKKSGKNLSEFLNEIYSRFSLHRDELYSLTLRGKEGQERIARIMTWFRENPPASFNNIDTASIRDIKTGRITDFKTGEITSVTELPSSDVLQFYLEDGSRITLRPSGTEPKIKFYFNIRDNSKDGEIEQRKILLDKKMNDLIKDFLEMAERVD